MPAMDYSLVNRTPDGTGKILVTTPGSPDTGSYVLESDMKSYINQGMVAKTDIVQSLGQQTDKVPSNKAVDDAISALIPKLLAPTTRLDASHDMNNITTVGTYYQSGGNDSMPAHAPYAPNAFIFVAQARDTDRVQIWASNNNASILYRFGVGIGTASESWGPWKQISASDF